MSHQIQSSKETDTKDFDEKIIISNQLHDENQNIGSVSNQRVVPKIRIHGMILEDESTVYDESDLEYDTIYDSYTVNSKDSLFMDYDCLDLSVRQYSNKLINQYRTVKQISEIVNIESEDYFLINIPDSNDNIYYICSVKYDLIGEFNVGSDMYEQQILYNEYDSVKDILRSKFIELDTVEYEFNNSGELKLRNKSDHRFDLCPEKFEDYMTKYSKITFGTLISSSFSGMFAPNIFIYPIMLSMLSIFGIAFAIIYYEELIDNRWIYPEGRYDSTDSNILRINDIKNMYHNNLENLQDDNSVSGEIRLIDNNLVYDELGIKWSIYNSSYGVYEKRAIRFFKDIGFDSIQSEFSGTIVPNENIEQYDCEFLISDCGEYAILAQ